MTWHDQYLRLTEPIAGYDSIEDLVAELVYRACHVPRSELRIAAGGTLRLFDGTVTTVRAGDRIYGVRCV